MIVLATYDAMPATEYGERWDVADGAVPATHLEEDHLARYHWAVRHARGEILDVACGTGYGARMLADRGAVVGVDRHGEALSRARDRVPSGRFLAAELPEIPLPDASVDTVVCVETIEHLHERRVFLRELLRVLRPGGQLLVTTPNREVVSPEGPPSNPWHIHEYDLEELVTEVRGAGFEPVAVECQRLLPHHGLRRQALRLVSRFPSLCRPGRWWDRLAHDTPAVRPWREGEVPQNWALRCVPRSD